MLPSLTPADLAAHVLLYLQHEKFQSAPGSRVGTPAYLAPEVIMTTKGQTYDGKVSSSMKHCLKQWGLQTLG